jgi:catechol 2,3-dioxygenase-like lactoylglutathione lyase family enzyme
VSDDTLIDLLAAENKPADDASNNNLNHFRLLVSPRDLKGLLTRLKRERVTPDREPRPRWGAHGPGTSVYIHDPNGNQIELKTFP